MARKPERHLITACLAALVAACLAASCTEGEGLPATTGDDAPSITFTTPQTRAAVTDANQMAAFDVWAWKDSGEQVFPVDDALLVENTGSGWEYDPRYLTRWEEGSTYDFYALYPSAESKVKGYESASYDEDGTLTVTGFDCSAMGTDAVDLMTAASGSITYAEGGNPPGSVQLSFQHELARVKFTVKSGNTVATVSSFKVYGLNYKGTLTKAAGTATWSDATACDADDTPFHSEEDFTFNTTNGFEKDMLGEILLMPHTETELAGAKLSIAYRYPGETEDRISTIGLNTAAITQWEAGSGYHYTLTIEGGTLNINVTVTGWTERNTSVSWG